MSKAPHTPPDPTLPDSAWSDQIRLTPEAGEVWLVTDPVGAELPDGRFVDLEGKVPRIGGGVLLAIDTDNPDNTQVFTEHDQKHEEHQRATEKMDEMHSYIPSLVWWADYCQVPWERADRRFMLLPGVLEEDPKLGKKSTIHLGFDTEKTPLRKKAKISEELGQRTPLLVRVPLDNDGKPEAAQVEGWLVGPKKYDSITDDHATLVLTSGQSADVHAASLEETDQAYQRLVDITGAVLSRIPMKPRDEWDKSEKLPLAGVKGVAERSISRNPERTLLEAYKIAMNIELFGFTNMVAWRNHFK